MSDAATLTRQGVALQGQGKHQQAVQCFMQSLALKIDDAVTHYRLGVSFRDVNVLADPALREGIKEFSNWPTIPQVYVGGKFIGGCDIVRDMYQSGELEPMVRAATGAEKPAS